jgi:hypothetical protein
LKEILIAPFFKLLKNMNKLFGLCLLALASTNLSAQGLSAGLRANAGYRLPAESKTRSRFQSNYQSLLVTPEVFVRYETGKRWAWEASFNRSAYSRPEIKSDIYDGPYDSSIMRTKGHCNDLNVSLQYRLGRSAKKFHHYAGVNLGLFMLRGEQSFYHDYAQTDADVIFKESETGLWVGGNYAVNYDLGKRLKLTSSVYFKVNAGTLSWSSFVWEKYQPTAQFGLQLGAAYRIF